MSLAPLPSSSPPPSVYDAMSPAQRARSIVVSSNSLTVEWDGGRLALTGRHVDLRNGAIVLAVPVDSTLVRELDIAVGGDVPVLLHFTDVCPVSARRRTRGQLRIAGWLAPVARHDEAYAVGKAMLDDSPGSVLLLADIAEVQLIDGDAELEVELDDYGSAAADPLANSEAAHLQHLATHHDDAVALLSRLVDARIVQHALRVLPAALTSRGLTLRVEGLRTDTDVFLAFRRAVCTVEDIGTELSHLIAEALCRPCSPRLA